MIILFGLYARWEQFVKYAVMEWNNKLEYKSNFDLLRKAYVDFRYSKEYAITQEELKYLRVKIDII
jgi:hypothetical protein